MPIFTPFTAAIIQLVYVSFLGPNSEADMKGSQARPPAMSIRRDFRQDELKSCRLGPVGPQAGHRAAGD